MAGKQQFDVEISSFLDSITDSINEDLGTPDSKNILDFIDNDINKETWGVTELNPRQILLLKTFYGLSLTEEELSILESWYALDRLSFNPLFYTPGTTYQSLCIEAGRRGSKSFLAAIIGAYEFYRLCAIRSPQKHYNIATSTAIAIYCIATSATQTKRTIFSQIKGLLEHIPFIKRLVDKKKIIIGEEEIKYPDKLLYIYSGNSNSASQVGSSVICLLMDEVARFDEEYKISSSDNESNALKLWSNIGISGVTFGKDAKRIAISSAWCEGDAIQVLYGISKSSTGWLGFRLRSWDLNPVHASRDNPVIQAEYHLDPRKAALEFEGVRFNNISSFFKDEEITRAFRGSSSIHVSSDVGKDKLVRIMIHKVLPTSLFSAMHIDPAFITDSFAVAFGHREIINKERYAIIDGILVWDNSPEQTVGITNVYNCIYQIHSYRPLSKITSDHYNPETVQHLRNTGLNASVITFTQARQLELYDFFRKMLHEDRVILPVDSIWSTKLKDELYGINLIKNRKIDHRKDGSKDISDAVVSVVWHLMSDFSSLEIPSTNSIGNSVPSNPNPNFLDSDLTFSNSSKELTKQVRRSYRPWKYNSFSNPLWSYDD